MTDEESVNYFMQQSLHSLTDKLPDVPNLKDKESLHQAKVLMQLFAFEGLPPPEKLLPYIKMGEVLAAKIPKEVRKKHKDKTYKNMAMNIKILQKCCDMSREDAYDEAIKRQGLHTEVNSLISKISNDYPIREGDARLKGKKLMEAFGFDSNGLKKFILKLLDKR